MAQRRMFSKDITENDAFLDMPLSTQALYFHLGMQADDDGFVSPNRILRMLGCQPDDLKILVAKRFVLQFEDGIVVIKHWKMNNYLRGDRHKQTVHKDKLALLREKDNNSYTLSTNGIPVVDAGKYSIGKVSIVKDSLYSTKNQKGGDYKDFDRFQMDDGTTAIMEWGVWKDDVSKATINRGYYKECPPNNK